MGVGIFTGYVGGEREREKYMCIYIYVYTDM